MPEFRKKEPSDDLLLFLQNSGQTGVYRASRGSLVDKAAALLEYDGDCVLIASNDGREGFVLDYEADASPIRRYTFEYWNTK